MRRSTGFRLFYLVLVAISVGLVYSMAFGLSGCPGPEARLSEKPIQKFAKEPTITVYIHGTGQRVSMPIETYIEGVVAGEMEKGWPVNAYAAQAIIARTFTMEFLSKGGTRKLHGTDICTDPGHAQAYNAAAVTPDIRKAVSMTRGEVLSYRGRYIHAWFHALCGGETTLARDGLAYDKPEPPYTQRVRDVCTKYVPSDTLFWKAYFPAAEIKQTLAGNGLTIGDITRIRTVRQDPTGRSTLIRISHSTGTTDIAGNDLRVALGSDRMRSTWLSRLDKVGDVVVMEGRGFGHGVGMCQWGAYALAKEGWSPEEIATHYFKGVRVAKLWD
ncbi:MAG TPA: SpoIID/LytB domain-containing protein [Firmicutes bacterium]|nr:SpoIID/LytB domain-containing protein [Bacillota bacterium]